MARGTAPVFRWAAGALARPFVLIGLAFVLVGLAELTGLLPGPVRAFLVLGALLLAGGAVSRRLQSAGQDIEERTTSAALVALAGLVALLAYPATPADWDSIRLLFAMLTAVALCGSVLVILPRLARRIVASLLVLFHFGGIATAVTAVPIQGNVPWVSIELWVHVYRPYLQFMYLTNAYHFYSPDPGPPTLIWFRIHYDDGTARWFKIPVREENSLGLNYLRMLAMAESINQPGRAPMKEKEIKALKARGQPYEHESWETILDRRTVGGATKYTPPLYLPADVQPESQYSEPTDYAKGLISAYARHVALTSPHPTNPQARVTDVRVYRLTHNIIRPAQVAQGYSPLHETFYAPYYEGMFDTDGNLLDPHDPFLYWYVPMVMVPKNYGEEGVPLVVVNELTPQTGILLNGLSIHSGDAEAVPLKVQDKP